MIIKEVNNWDRLSDTPVEKVLLWQENGKSTERDQSSLVPLSEGRMTPGVE